MLPEVNAPSEKNVPASLIYEVLDGQPVYYRGYEEVMAKTKTLDDIMGSSGLQSFLLACIMESMLEQLDRKKYKVLSNEVGIRFGKNDHASLDLAVVDRATLLDGGLQAHYLAFPPELVVEVDTKATPESFGSYESYMQLKTQKLLTFGVKEVLWVTSTAKKLIHARPGRHWITAPWADTLPLACGLEFNLAAILKAEGYEG